MLPPADIASLPLRRSYVQEIDPRQEEVLRSKRGHAERTRCRSDPWPCMIPARRTRFSSDSIWLWNTFDSKPSFVYGIYS